MTAQQEPEHDVIANKIYPHPQKQEPEYIITESELDRIEQDSVNGFGDCMFPPTILSAIRSRPHSLSLRPPCEECIYQSKSAERDASIAAQATAAENKRVLDDLWNKFKDIACGEPDGVEYCGTELKVSLCGATNSIHSVLESLRLAQPEPPIFPIDYSTIFKELSSTMDTNPTSLSDHQLNAIETYCRTLGTKARTIIHARHPKMPKHSPIER
jgi:hypothetical protein